MANSKHSAESSKTADTQSPSLPGDDSLKPIHTSSEQAPAVTKKTQPQRVPMHKLFRFSTRLDKFMIACAIICSVLVGLLQPLSIVLFGLFVDKVMTAMNDGESPVDATQPLILVFVYLGTIILVLAYIANAFWVLTGERQTRRIRQLYVHAILRQDMSWFDQSQEGSLTTRIAADAQLIQDGISEKFGALIRALAAFVMGFIMAFAVGWRLSVIILAVLPLLAGAGGAMGYLITKYTLRVQDAYADAGAVAEQVFSGLRTVYAFSLQARFNRIYKEKLVKGREVGVKRGIIMGLGIGTFLFVLFCVYAIGFWYGGQLIERGSMKPVMVLIAFFCMLLGSMSLLQTPANISAIATACGAAHRIFHTIDTVPTIDMDNQGGLKPEKVVGKITFQDVQFAYPTRPDVTILNHFNLTIKPGQTIAFVGPSGSGKSTLVQLIQRFYDPLAGRVMLDNVDVKDINLSWLRRQIGIVSQEPVLFNMTIRQNLLMGTFDQVSQEDIVEACKKANCHSFISKLPNGYDTLVGEHGGMLSGGQKQRIAIARAILRNPPILLLDEATSALDTQSERLVQRALDAAAASRTTIMIAHRLSTIRNADLIVVMKQGVIVEQGSHNELLAKKGVYADLVLKQQIAVQETGGEDEVDEELLLQKESEAIRETIEKATALQEKEASMELIRRSTVSSIDAYELKMKRDKADRKLRQKQSAPLGKILAQMRPEWHLLVLGCIGAVIAGAIFPVFAFIIAKALTELFMPDVARGPMEGTNLYAFLFLIFGIIAFLGFGMQFMAFEVAGERYTERLRGMVFSAYTRQEIGYFDQEDHNLGALTSKLAIDAKNVNQMVTQVWGDVMQIVATSVTGLVIAFVHTWEITLIVLAMSPFVMGASFYDSKIQRGFEDKTAKAHEFSGEVAGEAIKEIRTVASLGKQAYFEAKYERATERPHRLARQKAYLSSIGYALSQGVVLYVGAVSFYAGMRLIERQSFDFMDLMVALLASMITVSGVGRASVFASTYAKAKNSAIATFEILERQPLIDAELEGIEPSSSAIHGNFSFRDIAFRYPARPDYPVFDGDFHLEGKGGQTIALVGPSGCGKSTLIGMLERWYDPLGGTVRLDEHNVKQFSVGNLRSHMSLVGQEPVLFDMSIGDNIRFGVPEDQAVTEEEIHDVCRAANIHDFIMGLPDGYNTRVGDKGSQLSGGQKQRIAIARALIRKPRILLLDEATSALDSESEKLVQAAIDNIINEGGRTTITIAHRLSTIQNADLICVIKDGRVIEQDTHAELIKLNGVYAELVRQQSLQAH